jgi:phosphoribosylanthranilate isomerase
MLNCKICGVSDPQTLNYIINHKNPPKFVGFICNYLKSRRYINFEKLKKLINIKKKNFFVAVLVRPNKDFLEKIKNLNFDYYQLYDVTPETTKLIKKKYKKKIISALTIRNEEDVQKYKDYSSISDIILFDGKGYERSVGFNHRLLNDVPNTITKMLAGNIQYNDKLDKYSKIADIIDISGSLETSGKKDIRKVNIFLENINKFNNEN